MFIENSEEAKHVLGSEGEAEKEERFDFALQKLTLPLNVLRDLTEHLRLHKMMVTILTV